MSALELVQLMQRVADDRVAPLRNMLADGVVEAVANGKASVRVGGPSATPISGFTFSPMLYLQPGDHVLVYRLGGYQLVLTALNRDATAARPVYDVRDYGARGGGANDTQAIVAACQAARTTGGIVFLPFLCGISATILLPSGVSLEGAGWATGLVALASAWADLTSTYLVINEQYAAATYADANMAVSNLCFDYGQLGPSGTYHALEFRQATGIRVDKCLFLLHGNGDAVAGLHVDDMTVTGCSAYDFRNCAWDWWTDPSNIVVDGNYAETSLTNQMVNFNPDWTVSSPGTAAIGIKVVNNTFINNGTGYASVYAECIRGGAYVQDVQITGNIMVNTQVTARGDVRQLTVDQNVYESPKDLPAVFCYPLFSATPTGVTVTANQIYNPDITAGNLGVLRVEAAMSVIAHNICMGGTNAVPLTATGTTTPTLMGNLSDTDTTVRNILRKRLQLASGVTTHNDLEVTNTGTNGANVQLTGDGATTPIKYLRARAGLLEVVDSAYTNVLLALTDTGAMQLRGPLMPGNEAGGLQSTVHLYESAGVPSNANGVNGDWCLSPSHLYNKVAGAWVQMV